MRHLNCNICLSDNGYQVEFRDGVELGWIWETGDANELTIWNVMNDWMDKGQVPAKASCIKPL